MYFSYIELFHVPHISFFSFFRFHSFMLQHSFISLCVFLFFVFFSCCFFLSCTFFFLYSPKEFKNQVSSDREIKKLNEQKHKLTLRETWRKLLIFSSIMFKNGQRYLKNRWVWTRQVFYNSHLSTSSMKELIIPKQFVHFQAILLSFSKERRDAKFPFSFKTLILTFFEILFLKISKTNTVSFILS